MPTRFVFANRAQYPWVKCTLDTDPCAVIFTQVDSGYSGGVAGRFGKRPLRR